MDDLDVAPIQPKGSKLPMILAAVNLVVMIVIGVRVFTGSSGSASAAQPAAPQAKTAEPGPTVELEAPLVVNLNEPKGGRYLKALVIFEVANKDAAKDFGKMQRVIRDDLIRFLSGLRVKQTMGEKGISDIQAEMVKRADKHLGGANRVTRVFFTEFVVQ